MHEKERIKNILILKADFIDSKAKYGFLSLIKTLDIHEDIQPWEKEFEFQFYARHVRRNMNENVIPHLKTF